MKMNQTIKIRNEKTSDYKIVEEITREAFYNLYIPGCVEHYLIHIMRDHERSQMTAVDYAVSNG